LIEHLIKLEAYFARREPEVLAFVPEDGRFERLRRDAEDLFRSFPDPAARPPLFGMPVGIKDIFNVDGLPTRAGTDLSPELFFGPEASCVTRLKDAGALVFGKTVTTQFAYFAPGPTRHPLSVALGEVYTPGGSSSGSAAAVAAGFTPLALGTQTIGSIIRPAAYCGVVGFKPSYGRIAMDGIIPLAPSIDTTGFFVRTAADAGLVASLLISDWRRLAPTGRSPVMAIPIGPYLARASAEGLAHFRAVSADLKSAGYAVLEVPVMYDFEDVYRCHNRLVAAEAARTHARWFETYRKAYHPKTAELILRGRTVSEADYQRALASRMILREEIHRVMDRYGIDFWICPAAVGPAPRTLESTGDPVMALPWTHAGLPCVSLPAGGNSIGLPMGLQIVGRFGTDEELVAKTESLSQNLLET
jgi:Asp-tRNA(Asn)/Glu-tRNA(Gln) amidotransferase A subunit family amidase